MFATCSRVSRAAAFRGKRLNAERVWKKCPPSAAHATHAGMQVITRAREHVRRRVAIMRSRSPTCVGISCLHFAPTRPRSDTTRPRKSDRAHVRAYRRVMRQSSLSSPLITCFRMYLDLSIRNSKLQHPTTFSRRCVSCCHAMSDWKVNPGEISARRNKRSTDPFTRRERERYALPNERCCDRIVLAC